ncbi:hypothetical protein QFC20_003092 [Naganishia adeliensis]|uniref:Uncharacterized protein n=1 Tax=Naganishia adeliensis TaxID=92952 RepID=A0ACC2WE40_9TREE|nr:hypothetical protein QFC20_003092 [Naganishia adeliensis]
MDLPLDHPIYRRLRMNNATPSPQRWAVRGTPRPAPVTPSSIPRSYPSHSPASFGPSLVRRTPGTRESGRNGAHDLYSDRLESEGSLAFHTDGTDDPAFQQWTTHHIEWRCRDLSEFLAETTDTPLHERSALLGKVISETKFRLDVVLNTHSSASTDRQADVPNLDELNLDDETTDSTPCEVDTFKPHFSVYVAPAFTTYGEYRGGVPKSADIFLGIKPNNVPAGPGEGQDRWLWSKAESHFFSDDSCDFWEASLPPISELLLDSAIREQDCFTLVLRLQTPATNAAALHGTEKRLVDRNLLLGPRSLLDDANMGDIRLICLERDVEPNPLAASDSGLGIVEHTPKSNRYRKRVLYAHSSIIKLRSEYLDDWIRFSSDEQGTPGRGSSNRGDRATHSVTCLDVDFVTMYWFLHFLYTGELEFKTVEDTTNTAAFPVESLDRDTAEQLVSESADGSSLVLEDPCG